MNLYIVSSFYQLYNSINVVYNNKRKNDIIIVKKNIYNNVDRAKLLEVFKNVYYWGDIFENIYDDNIKTNMDRIKAILSKIVLFNNKNIINYLPNKNDTYEKVYIAYPDYPSQLIYYHFKTKDSRLCFLEDGTYTYECFAAKTSFFRKAISTFLFGSFVLNDCKEVLVRDTKFFNYGYRKDLTVKGIDSIADIEYFKYLQDVFKDRSLNLLEFKRDIIFFDQNIELLSVKELQYSFVKKILTEFSLGELMDFREGTSSNKWFYSLKIDKSKVKATMREVITALEDFKVGTRAIWGLIHEQKPYLEDLAYEMEKAPYYSSCILNFPSSTNLTKDDIEYTVEQIKKVLGDFANGN